jgi:flagellar biosynthetic protein FlhB
MIFSKGFSFARAYAFDSQLVLQHLATMVTQGVLTLLPFLGIIVVIAIFAPMLIGGFNFSLEAINFKWDRLDPINGLKKMFSWKVAVEFLKAILKFSLVVLFSYLIFKKKIVAVFALDKAAINVAIYNFADILLAAGLVLALALVIIAMIDIPFQFWDHARQLRMTKQEIRDDLKDTEGKPEVRRKIKEKQRQLSRRRMMAKVATANVVITNPSHFAVAIKYDEAQMMTPIVVAKGADLIAEMIKKVAKANKVPFVAAPPLARALYYHVELDAEIPTGLYVAVAKILAYVYELELYNKGQGNAPTEPSELPIPKELQA